LRPYPSQLHQFLGGVPVLVRVANVTSPFGYTMVHLYPDGRILVIQKSQHFPFDDFISSRFQPGGLGSEADRYLTLGGTSQLPLGRLKVAGADASASIVDGHLRLTARNERSAALVDTSELKNARISLTAVKVGGERMGGIALSSPDGTGGIEAAVTSRYSPDGKVFLASNRSGGRDILARSWFNIADNIAYRLVLEVGTAGCSPPGRTCWTSRRRSIPARKAISAFSLTAARFS